MRNGQIRRVLVVFQFAISILLITGTLVMYRQIFFMLNKDVGFNKEQLLVINMARLSSEQGEIIQGIRKGDPGSN